eukprot:2365620-Rhodomonas_salina.1
MKRAPDISTALAMLSSDVFVSNKVQRVLPGWNVNSSDAANNNLRLAPLLAENMHPNSNLHGAPMLKLSADDVKSNMARQMASQQQWPSSLNPNQQNGHASNRIVDDADANVHRAKIALMEDRFRRCMCTGKPVDAKDQQEYEELCAMMLQYSGHTQQEPSSWKKDKTVVAHLVDAAPIPVDHPNKTPSPAPDQDPITPKASNPTPPRHVPPPPTRQLPILCSAASTLRRTSCRFLWTESSRGAALRVRPSQAGVGASSRGVSGGAGGADDSQALPPDL